MEAKKVCAADCSEFAGFAFGNLFLRPKTLSSALIHPGNVSLCFSFTLHVFAVDFMSKYEVVAFGYGILHHAVYYILSRLTLAPG